MKKDEHIRHAIDESLGSVRFHQGDMRAVLRAVREQESIRRPARRKRVHFAPAFAAMMTVMVLAPLSIFALRTLRAGSSIATITPLSSATQAPDADPIVSEDPILSLPVTPQPVRAGTITENDAILAARACFEAQCDTAVFTFEEYTVRASFSEGDGYGEYVVEMNSIYDNGCAFSVTISARDGSVLSHSTPKLATVPTRLNAQSEEIMAWYDKYGPYLFTWPSETQAEFSRRYEGALLRMPRENEITAEDILKRAPLFADALTPDGGSVGVYQTLYDGRAFADGQARYLIYCFPGGYIDDVLPESYLLVTMLAGDGTIESSELLPTSEL